MLSGSGRTTGCAEIKQCASDGSSIAILDRGDCAFSVKVANAEQAKAIATVVVDTTTPPSPPDLGDYKTNSPVVMISQEAGQRIRKVAGVEGSRVQMSIRITAHANVENADFPELLLTLGEEQVLVMCAAGSLDEDKCSILRASIKSVQRNCSTIEMKRQVKSFAQAQVGSGCTSPRWLKMLHIALPNATTFIDIGANKLYTTAAFYALWQPKAKCTPQTLYKALVAEQESGITGGEDNLCGVCNDCREELSPFIYPQQQQQLRVFSFDGQANLVEQGRRLMATHFPAARGFSIEHTAVSDKAGVQVVFGSSTKVPM
jgi:hypothetical protein